MKAIDQLFIQQMQNYLNTKSATKGLTIKTDSNGYWLEDASGQKCIDPSCLAELSASRQYAEIQFGLKNERKE